MHSRGLSMLAMSWLCVACGDEPKEEQKPEEVRTPAAVKLDSFKKGSLATTRDAQLWARLASAPNVYVYANAPSLISLGLGGSEEEADASCPAETTQGLNRRITGGCTDKNGLEWLGSSEEKAGLTGITTTYSGFGYLKTVTCEGKTAQVKLVYEGTHSLSLIGEKQGFETHLITEAVAVDPETCAETTSVSAVEYKGTVDGASSSDPEGQTKPTTWNGSGRIGNSDTGVISAVTRDEVIHSEACATEALSGETTLTTDGHQVDIQYDGATDCADTATVQWSLDGAAQGKLEGINCSAAGGPALAAWSVGLLGALGLMRRRARN